MNILNIFSSNKVEPSSLFNTSYIEPELLRSVKINSKDAAKAQWLLERFDAEKRFRIRPSASSQLLEYSGLENGRLRMPSEFGQLINLAIKDPHAIIERDESKLNSDSNRLKLGWLPYITLIDLARVIILYANILNEPGRKSSSELPKEFFEGSFSSDPFADSRARTLIKLLTVCIRGKFNHSSIEHIKTCVYADVLNQGKAEDWDGENANTTNAKSIIKQITLNRFKTSTLSELPASARVDTEGAFIFLPFGEANTLLFDELYVHHCIMMLRIRLPFLSAIDAKILNNVNPNALVSSYDTFFIETMNAKFTAEFLTLNIRTSYPDESLPGQRPPEVEDIIYFPQDQHPYIEIAKAKALKAHAELMK